MSAGMRIGLDIGATKILGAVVGAGGIVLAQSREVTVPGADGVLATATTVLERLAAALDGGLPSHVGIGIPGIVDRDRGAVSHAVNLGLGSEWLPLADRLADRTGAVVVVENDLNAATWAVRTTWPTSASAPALRPASSSTECCGAAPTARPGRSATCPSTPTARSAPAGSAAAWN